MEAEQAEAASAYAAAVLSGDTPLTNSDGTPLQPNDSEIDEEREYIQEMQQAERERQRMVAHAMQAR